MCDENVSRKLCMEISYAAIRAGSCVLFIGCTNFRAVFTVLIGPNQLKLGERASDDRATGWAA